MSAPGPAGASPARRVALDVLLSVVAGGPTLSDRLAEADAEKLDPRDRGFLHELVLGTLRTRGALDFALASAVDRPLSQIEPRVLSILRMGAYQVLRLRVPARAAVSESVALAHERVPRAAGFVNAILRRLARDGAPPEPDAATEPVRWLTTVGSLPEWLADRWMAQIGAEETIARARALGETPRVVVRLSPRGDAASRVADLAPRPLTVPGAFELRDSPSQRLLAEGVLYVQDEGSQLVAHLASTPGWVLDACAAPGGKSTLLADLGGRVLATEIGARRAATLASLAKRWGAASVSVVRADSRRPPAQPGTFDSVLLDAPCSGLGTLSRHPDLRWRIAESDIARHAVLQGELLRGVAPLVKPGGSLVYATCSLEPEENEGVVAPFLEANPSFRPGPLPDWALLFADGPFLRTRPERHGMDGFFAARLVRVSDRGSAAVG